MSERDPEDGLLNDDDRPGQNLNRGAGSDGVPIESLALRIRRLEDLAFEGDGLRRSVDRLGLNASALGEALLQVDRNQQQLTQLGTELRKVESLSVSDVEVHAITEMERARNKHERRQDLMIGIVPAVLVLFALIFGLSQAAHDACEKRHEATRANIDVLMGFKTGVPASDFTLQRGIDRLEATLSTTCDDQYWLHLP